MIPPSRAREDDDGGGGDDGLMMMGPLLSAWSCHGHLHGLFHFILPVARDAIFVTILWRWDLRFQEDE